MYSIYKDFYFHHRNLVHERNTARHAQKNSKSGHISHIFILNKKYDLGRAEDISCNYIVVKQKIKVSYYLKKRKEKKHKLSLIKLVIHILTQINYYIRRKNTRTFIFLYTYSRR